MREGTYPGPGPKPLSNWINLLGSLQVRPSTSPHIAPCPVLLVPSDSSPSRPDVLCARWLQLADLVTRKTGAHLEYESTVWMHAFSLALPLASTCSVIIQQASRPSPPSLSLYPSPTCLSYMPERSDC